MIREGINRALKDYIELDKKRAKATEDIINFLAKHCYYRDKLKEWKREANKNNS